MFTVVIAEKEHIEKIQDYRIFLEPFLDKSRVAFCPWYPEQSGLARMVPDLIQTVAKTPWRAIVVCPEDGLEQKNPFDRVIYHEPERMPDQTTEDWLDEVKAAKFAAFEQAAQQPLTRLMAYLCDLPLVSEGRNHQSQIDPEFREYQEENRKKREVLRQITGGWKPTIELPTEIICLTRRTCPSDGYDIQTAWIPHLDLQYSSFADRNMYFEKMRYLVFDIVPHEHKDYQIDYLRFLYMLLVLANYSVPSDCLRPERVYRLECKNDDQALKRLITSYDAKLEQTALMLRQRISQLEQMRQEHLSDQDARAIFCSDINIPLQMSNEIDRGELYADRRAIGLAGDCPAREDQFWRSAYVKTERTLYEMLKQPKRALKKSTDDMRQLNRADTTHADQLNDFQKEDLREYIARENSQMMSLQTENLYDYDQYRRKIAPTDKAVRQKIETRMTKKSTVALGLLTLLLFLVGFVPVILSSVHLSVGTLYAFLITLGALFLLAAVGLVCLLFLRRAVVKLISAFNAAVAGIESEIQLTMRRFSEYLSHVCNIMRGYFVLNYCEGRDEPKMLQIRILNKHIADIAVVQTEVRDVFGVVPKAEFEQETVEPYDFDFSTPADFRYPLPFTESMQRKIEYMQAGNVIQVPVDFIQSITVRREELYD